MLLSRYLLPSIAMAAAAMASAATVDERDAHVEAVKALIERDYRMPAQRQLEDWKKSAYPDEGGWWQKALDWSYADRFKTRTPDAAEAAKLAALAKKLREELDAAAKDNKLPEGVKNWMGAGASSAVRLVNQILNLVNRDSPPPITGLASIPAERKTEVTAAVAALCAKMVEDWKAAKAKVEAFSKEEDKLNDMRDGSKEYNAIFHKIVLLRLDAVNAVYLPWLALREVAARGDQFGIDPKPAAAALSAWAKENGEVLQNWDFQWGDAHPAFHVFSTLLLGEAVKAKLKGFTADDLETELMKTCDLNVATEFKGDVKLQAEIKALQLKSWAGMIRLRQALATDRDLARGAELWTEYVRRAKDDPTLSVDSTNRQLAEEAARVVIAGGNLLLAKGDQAGGKAAFARLAGSRSNPLAYNGREWVSARSGGDNKSSEDPWAATPTPEDPTAAINTARAFLSSANDLSDPVQARAMVKNAAALLRNGILGLSTSAYSDQFVATAPELYYRYIRALSQLELRWQAAIVSVEGLRALKERIDAGGGKRNPWMSNPAKGEFTESGRYVSLLAKNAIAYCDQLRFRAKGSATSTLFGDMVDLVKVVSPGDAGQGLEKSQIYALISEGDFDGALTAARDFQKKYPEERLAIWSLIISIHQRRLGKAGTDKAMVDKAAKDMEADAAKITKEVADELPTAKDPVRQRALIAADNAAKTASVSIKLSSGRFEEVMKQLGAEFWKNPPTDPDLALEMIKALCSATQKFNRERIKDEKVKADPQALIAVWQSYADAHESWTKVRAKLKDKDDQLVKYGQNLADVMAVVNSQCEWFRRPGQVKDLPAQIATIHDLAKRKLADLVEPVISPASKPEQILSVASLLWGMDETKKAARLYEMYRQKLAADNDLAVFKKDPKAILDTAEALVSPRPELKADWAVIRDLLEDKPTLAQLMAQGAPEKDWGEKRRDYSRAFGSLKEFRAKVLGMKTVLGAGFAAVDTGLASLERQVLLLAQEVTVLSNLAKYYRSSGEKPKASALYDILAQYDPTDPDVRLALVEITIDRLKIGEVVPPADLEKARANAISIREDRRGSGDRADYWTAAIQVVELSLALKDTKPVENTLAFWRRNKETPADDLQILPREKRDDPRVRRARNDQAVVLADRYLKLFGNSGVAEKPPYQIVQIQVNGKPMSLFVPPDAPAFAPVVRDVDNVDVLFFWEDGKEPPPEPEPVAAAPAPDAAPGASASAAPTAPSAPSATAAPVAPAPKPK